MYHTRLIFAIIRVFLRLIELGRSDFASCRSWFRAVSPSSRGVGGYEFMCVSISNAHHISDMREKKAHSAFYQTSSDPVEKASYVLRLNINVST